MKRIIGYSIAIIVFACVLFVYPTLSLEVKPSKGCSDCNYCRMKIEGVDMTEIKKLSQKTNSEIKATVHGMITITSLSADADIALFQDYYKKRYEKMEELDKDENTLACKCCGCYDRANARNSGKLNEEVIPFERGIVQLITSQDKEEVKKLHDRVEKFNKTAREK